MGKGRVRIKGGKSSKNRWKKGQSGASNPVSNKHRNAAKGKFRDHLAQTHGTTRAAAPLTASALATHDGEAEDMVTSSQDTEGSTIGGSTVYSLIDNSNDVFSQVKKLWNSPLESHRQVCAVLAAASEVVKEKGGKDTETEYLGVLLSALESSDVEAVTGAILYLLSIVMKRVDDNVLQAQFNTISKILMEQLSHHENSNSTPLLKSLVSCMSTLLLVQPAPVWSDSYIQTILQSLLNFTVHTKPKLRKSAHFGITSMLRNGGSTFDSFHPAAPFIAKHCLSAIEKGGVETTALHTVVMLRDCLDNFPTRQVKVLCEAILKLMTLGNTVVKTTSLHCLHGLFTSKSGPSGLTKELNGQLIAALYDRQPNMMDTQLLMAWITVMEGGHLRLYSLDGQLCLTHLSKLFTVCMQCLLTEKTPVLSIVSDVMKNIIARCVPSAVAVIERAVDNDGRAVEKRLKKLVEYSSLLGMFR